MLSGMKEEDAASAATPPFGGDDEAWVVADEGRAVDTEPEGPAEAEADVDAMAFIAFGVRRVVLAVASGSTIAESERLADSRGAPLATAGDGVRIGSAAGVVELTAGVERVIWPAVVVGAAASLGDLDRDARMNTALPKNPANVAATRLRPSCTPPGRLLGVRGGIFSTPGFDPEGSGVTAIRRNESPARCDPKGASAPAKSRTVA